MISPVLCSYAPPGEYIKDHTLVYNNGWWHLFSISGTRGYCHLYNGNEETISWSLSRNLVDWEFRGHILHASLRIGEFDCHEVWSPYCLAADRKFYMFYTGVQHPFRPMCYERKGHLADADFTGHKETIGLAVSEDFTFWEKVSNKGKGLSIPGRDPHVVFDKDNGRWLLYSTGRNTGGRSEAYVSQSFDLLNWDFTGVCAVFPDPPLVGWVSTESLTVMKHPVTKKWIMLGNWQYAVTDDPLDFTKSEVKTYFSVDENYYRNISGFGFAGEIVNWEGKWYRSGVMGPADNWVLGFHEIEWNAEGAFSITQPGIVRCLI